VKRPICLWTQMLAKTGSTTPALRAAQVWPTVAHRFSCPAGCRSWLSSDRSSSASRYRSEWKDTCAKHPTCSNSASAADKPRSLRCRRDRHHTCGDGWPGRAHDTSTLFRSDRDRRVAFIIRKISRAERTRLGICFLQVSVFSRNSEVLITLDLNK
jgi:hypothetical protein